MLGKQLPISSLSNTGLTNLFHSMYMHSKEDLNTDLYQTM